MLSEDILEDLQTSLPPYGIFLIGSIPVMKLHINSLALSVDEHIGGTLFCSDFQNFRLSCSWQLFEIASSCSCQKRVLALGGMFIPLGADTPKETGLNCQNGTKLCGRTLDAPSRPSQVNYSGNSNDATSIRPAHSPRNL